MCCKIPNVVDFHHFYLPSFHFISSLTHKSLSATVTSNHSHSLLVIHVCALALGNFAFVKNLSKYIMCMEITSRVSSIPLKTDSKSLAYCLIS